MESSQNLFLLRPQSENTVLLVGAYCRNSTKGDLGISLESIELETVVLPPPFFPKSESSIGEQKKGCWYLVVDTLSTLLGSHFYSYPLMPSP
jgi:hypothetical protein